MLTMLYDGQCALCRASAERVRRADRRRRLALLDLNDAGVASRFPQVDPAKARALMQVVDERGRVSSGVDAWARAGAELPGWRAVAWLLRLPGLHWLGAQVYGWVARNRYRWNRERCAEGTCRVHAPVHGRRP